MWFCVVIYEDVSFLTSTGVERMKSVRASVYNPIARSPANLLQVSCDSVSNTAPGRDARP